MTCSVKLKAASSLHRRRGSVSGHDQITTQLALIRTLRGLTTNFGSFNDGSL